MEASGDKTAVDDAKKENEEGQTSEPANEQANQNDVKEQQQMDMD